MEFAFPKPKTERKKRKPIRRKTWLRRRRPTPRRSGRVRDREHMLRVKRLGYCCARGMSRCRGAYRTHPNGQTVWHPAWMIEADHAGKHPTGRKGSDRECNPICPGHHNDRTDGAGPFKGWDEARMRAWLNRKLKETADALDEMEARELSHGSRRGR